METKTNLCAWGTSRAVRIPKKMCEGAEMETGAALLMSLQRDEQGPYIVIRPDREMHRSCSDAPYRSLDDLFAGYAGAYRPQELDWGEDVGGECVL